MIVGYKLVRDEDGETVAQWGGSYGQHISIPNPLPLPNGDQVCAASLGVSYAGHTLVEWEMGPPPVTERRVDEERDRRAARPFIFNNRLFQANVAAQKRINGACTLALSALTQRGTPPNSLRWHGGDTDFVWIAEDNTLVPMDAKTVLAFGQAAAAWESAHVFAARALKDQSPIPENYADDAFWPPQPHQVFDEEGNPI